MLKIKIIAFLPSADLCSRLKREWNIYCRENGLNRGGEFLYELETITSYEHGFDGMELDAEALIARGGAANDLRRHFPHLPVCEVPQTALDILNVVKECQEKYADQRIGVFGTENTVLYFESFSSVTRLNLSPYIIEGMTDMEAAIQRAKADGISVFVGGSRSCITAQQYGMHSVELSSEDAAFRFAIRQAVQSARGNIKLKQRLLSYQNMMNCIDEGIICVDSANRITMFNDYASALLKVDGENAIGKSYENIVHYPHLRHLCETKRQITDELIFENDLRLNINKINVSIRGENVGKIIHLQNITKIQQLEEQIRKKTHASGLVSKYRFEDIAGESQAIRDTIDMAKIYARADSNVLIEGQTGSGKELFAQSIHAFSSRGISPFVAVNCAAIPEPLLESELFGYVEGAFTGTRKGGKIGLFELAHKGTIFLDEVHSLSPGLQSRLLRVTQERELMRLGDDKIIPVDVRIISATNQNLIELARRQEFRDDLYFRLNVLRLPIPPLRDRHGDILLLARFFMDRYCAKTGQPAKTLAPAVEKTLLRYRWPGNIRELQNVCERICVLCTDPMVNEEFLTRIPLFDEAPSLDAPGPGQDFKEAVQNRERDLIMNALLKNGNSKTAAAAMLGMGRTTLWKKIRELGIE